MTISTVGIIGAGTMGNGIAQACAVSGIDVVMVDISDAAVQKGLATVAGSLDRLIKKEKLDAAGKAAALARIQGSTDYAALHGGIRDVDHGDAQARLRAHLRDAVAHGAGTDDADLLEGSVHGERER